MMYYDGSFLDVKPLHVHSAVHLVLVDLCGSKDTVQILNGLQAAYPAPSSSVHEGVHKLLGELNLSITKRAITALRDGNLATLGELMKEAQTSKHLLHQLLAACTRGSKHVHRRRQIRCACVSKPTHCAVAGKCAAGASRCAKRALAIDRSLSLTNTCPSTKC